METVCHGMLEGGSSILQTKGHYSIGECAPLGCECSLVTIFFPDLDLVISKKSVHEGKGLMFGACIDNVIDEGCWEVVFGTRPIEVAETVCHGALESGSNNFQAKGNDLVHKCAPWGCECRFIMVFFLDLDLVISGKSIHEGKDLMSNTCINNLIDEGCWEVVFGTLPI